MSKIIKPPALACGDTVSLIAPAFAFQREKFIAGKASLEETLELKTTHRPDVFDLDGYFSGTDQRRCDELFDALTDSSKAAVFGIRGGYGCARIYPELIRRLKKVKNLKPKIVHGYSDMTVLLNGLFQDLGWITFHGPVLVSKTLLNSDSLEIKTLRQSWFSDKALGKVEHPEMISLSPGSARAPMVGGCLSLVASSLGTPYEVQTKNMILFLEDVGERPYRIDRMLTQLLHAGTFDQVKGIVFGQMTDCRPPSKEEFGFETFEVLDAIKSALSPLLKKRKIPVVYNFPAGHGYPQITFPIGTRVEVQSQNKKSSVLFLESGCKRRS